MAKKVQDGRSCRGIRIQTKVGTLWLGDASWSRLYRRLEVGADVFGPFRPSRIVLWVARSTQPPRSSWYLGPPVGRVPA
jgi:hypothetical protein